MTDHYHSPDDRKFVRNLRQAAPLEYEAYQTFSAAIMGRKDGALSPRDRELVAMGVALTTQCVYCIESHAKAAVAAGVTAAELAEAVYVTAALRAGGGAAHGMLAMKLFEAAQPATPAE